jgi:hypothetical protein
VPFTTANEEFEPAILNHFAFAVEKLEELRDLDAIRNGQGAEGSLQQTKNSLRLNVLVKMLNFVRVSLA